MANSKLSSVLELAKKHNMPKATITRVIENATQAQINAREYCLEYNAPGGVGMLVKIYTDNLKRTKGFVNSCTKKGG